MGLRGGRSYASKLGRQAGDVAGQSPPKLASDLAV